MRILVIDDSRADRDLIIAHLHDLRGEKKFEADESNCLKDAVQKIKINNYDVILLDLILPESDGIETVQKVIATMHECNKKIPIIVLTGMDNYKIGRAIWGLGVKDYLIKDESGVKEIKRALNFATKNDKYFKPQALKI